jgi:hypothetical protein
LRLPSNSRGRAGNRQEALERAKIDGVGSGASTINLHGSAQNWHEVMKRVMRQIGRNINEGQFAAKPTILVVALPRTSIRSDAVELQQFSKTHGSGA